MLLPIWIQIGIDLIFTSTNQVSKLVSIGGISDKVWNVATNLDPNWYQGVGSFVVNHVGF